MWGVRLHSFSVVFVFQSACSIVGILRLMIVSLLTIGD